MVLNASTQEVAGPISLAAGLLLLPTVVLAHIMFIYLGKPRTMSTTLRSVFQRVRNLVGRPSCGRVRCYALPLSADFMGAGHGPSPGGATRTARGCAHPLDGAMNPAMKWFVHRAGSWVQPSFARGSAELAVPTSTCPSSGTSLWRTLPSMARLKAALGKGEHGGPPPALPPAAPPYGF